MKNLEKKSSTLSCNIVAVRRSSTGISWVEVGRDWRLSQQNAALIRDVAEGSEAAWSRSARRTPGSGCCASRWDRSEKGDNHGVTLKELATKQIWGNDLIAYAIAPLNRRSFYSSLSTLIRQTGCVTHCQNTHTHSSDSVLKTFLWLKKGYGLLQSTDTRNSFHKYKKKNLIGSMTLWFKITLHMNNYY